MQDSNTQKNKTEPVFSADDTVQVLALDGGGLRGLFTASVLKSIENQLGHGIADHFDIITGTSTGGLIALALGRKLSASDIQAFYLQNGEKIFPSKGVSGFARSMRQWIRAKYSNDVLRETLETLLRNEDGSQPTLGDSCHRLVIPTFLAGESKPRLLKTPHTERLRYDLTLPMWAVGLATSAAPTYLPAFDFDGRTYLDGGLWANNPSLVGMVEAKDLGARLRNIRVLNIGTTFSNSECIHQGWFFNLLKVKRQGVSGWARRILPTVMDANSYATSSMYVHQLLDKGQYWVINKQVDSGSMDLDRVTNSVLTEMGETIGESDFSKIETFFEHRAKPYTPIIE